MIAPEIAEQFAALDAMKAAAKDAGIELVTVTVPDAAVKVGKRWVCAKCFHEWRSHGFVGRRGGQPAELRCHSWTCRCVIPLESVQVDP